jgi:hypothetical protein
MPRSSKASSPQEPKSLLWLEQEILALTPQVGILDGASLGYLSVAEHVGKLAGAWRDHRILMRDLDTELVTASLGELLGSVVQMAHAVGVSLETVAEGQVQRMRATPMRVRQQKAPAKPLSKTIPPTNTLVSDAPAPPRRRKAQTQPAITVPAPHTSTQRRRTSTTSPVGTATASKTAPAQPTSRSPRATRSPAPAASFPSAKHTGVVAPTPRTSKRRRSAPPTIQPTLLRGEPATQRKRQSATPTRRASAS